MLYLNFCGIIVFQQFRNANQFFIFFAYFVVLLPVLTSSFLRFSHLAYRQVKYFFILWFNARVARIKNTIIYIAIIFAIKYVLNVFAKCYNFTKINFCKWFFKKFHVDKFLQITKFYNILKNYNTLERKQLSDSKISSHFYSQKYSYTSRLIFPGSS